MSIDIGSWRFEGPFDKVEQLRASAGVYAIIHRALDGTQTLIDVGESGDVKSRIGTHDRVEAWRSCRRPGGTILAAVAYTGDWSAEQRRTIERRIRGTYKPPCGER